MVTPDLGRFPARRLRRTRAEPWLRALVAETRLGVQDLVWPVFLLEGENRREEIPSMPGVARLSLDLLVPAVAEAASLGIPAVALFPMTPPERKTEDGAEALNPENLVCRALRRLRREVPGIGLICDVALDPYTSHGHDGLLRDGRIVNDETVDLLIRQALVQAEAGCHVIAPSDMMDGRIGALRTALDFHRYQDVVLLSYAAKYASAFYGPFRDAIGSKGLLRGDKRTYQMDSANGDEALSEVAQDLAEGADLLMVKPGLPYLDIIRRVKERFAVPVFAYQVSGEYAMMAAAGRNGWLDGDAALLESLLCLKRGGADAILTYGAVDIARRLRAG